MTTPVLTVQAASSCGHTSCPTAAVVHWTRLLTAAELAAIPVEQQNSDMQLMVFACSTHAITLDLAAQIHQSNCSGPNSASLPACDCTPGPATSLTPGPDVTTLASGWQITT